MGPKFLQRGRAQIWNITHKESSLVSECVPHQMGTYADIYRAGDQGEPAGWPPSKWCCERNEPRLMALRSHAYQRELHDRLKDPEHGQTYRQAEKNRPFHGMREVPARGKIEKVVKVRGQAAYDQRREYQDSPERHDGRRMRKSKRQVLMVAQVV